ncbi:hypothetical protein K4A83_21400 [Spirulina subsalsa FACHB-351]|uniref:Uncharacterized protein n=1 Tax=Spirulina subsalsa FACHB-351 TaxID=234711 RepID=A0ABT3LBD6_9CYAN|nr:hypothetical protein [Spirulina subsalsa]MCW6038805.1 hypothetical protein [Spirulina subsalsa FACHB-351]
MQLNRTFFLTAITLILLLTRPSPGEAKMEHSTPLKDQTFEQIEQPLLLKLAVTAGGLGLIGLELWWFLFKDKANTP